MRNQLCCDVKLKWEGLETGCDVLRSKKLQHPVLGTAAFRRSDGVDVLLHLKSLTRLWYYKKRNDRLRHDVRIQYHHLRSLAGPI